jgi:hypothetical protein
MLCRSLFFALAMAALSLASIPARAEGTRREGAFVEAGLGFSGVSESAYVQRLEDFRFESDIELTPPVIHAESIGYVLHPNFGVLLRHELLEERQFVRDLGGSLEQDEYGWTTRAISVGGRGRIPLVREWIALRAQLNVGLGLSQTRYKNHGERRHEERELGLAVGLVLGADFNFFKYGGAYVEAGYVLAPVLENNFGDRHDEGGATLIFGVRLRTLEGS